MQCRGRKYTSMAISDSCDRRIACRSEMVSYMLRNSWLHLTCLGNATDDLASMALPKRTIAQPPPRLSCRLAWDRVECEMALASPKKPVTYRRSVPYILPWPGTQSDPATVAASSPSSPIPTSDSTVSLSLTLRMIFFWLFRVTTDWRRRYSRGCRCN